MYNGVHSNDDIESQYIQNDKNFNVSHDFQKEFFNFKWTSMGFGHPVTIASWQVGKSPSLAGAAGSRFKASDCGFSA